MSVWLVVLPNPIDVLLRRGQPQPSFNIPATQFSLHTAAPLEALSMCMRPSTPGTSIPNRPLMC